MKTGPANRLFDSSSPECIHGLIEFLERRIAPATLPTLTLPELGGYAGFRIDSPVPVSAYANAGDFNGDGIGDLLALSSTANSNKGTVYVVFGRENGFGAVLNLASLDGTNGFVIQGAAANDKFGTSASNGDVNNDGKSDLIIGAPGNDSGASNAGSAYVIFGTTTPGASLVVTTLNGSNGFRITTNASGSAMGSSVASGGDFNSDGFDDLLVGAPDADSYGSNAGAAFLVFGKSSGFPSSLSTSSLSGADGFAFASQNNNERFGQVVTFSGDLNRDGYDDFSVGGHPEQLLLTVDGQERDVAYFLFGRLSSNALVTTAGLTSGNGFSIRDVGRLELGNNGYLQDFNGDGINDFVIYSGYKFSFSSAAAGLGFIAGKANAGFDSNPFANGSSQSKHIWTPFNRSGLISGNAADFNGDGFVDFALDPQGDVVGNVIFGKNFRGFNKFLGDAPLNKGFAIVGLNTGVQGLSFVGDINGDGSPELAINAGDGTTGYLVFGSGLNIAADGRSVKYRDGDGDLVTVKTSKGSFDYTQFVFDTQQTNGGKDLLALKLGLGGPEFADADISISVKKGKVKGVSDGLVEIGKIDAAGIDLGKVSVAGHLGEIDAGDALTSDLAIVSLTTKSFGRTAGGPTVASSDIKGGIEKVSIGGAFTDATFQTTGASGASISSFLVKGDFSGDLDVAGFLGSFSSADFKNGSQLSSGAAAAKPTSLQFRAVGDSTTIDIAGAISTFKAARVGESNILADRIASLVVVGNKAQGMKGDFLGNLTLDNGNGSFNGHVLGKASFSGLVQSALFSVNGSIGSFTAAAMETSSLFAGFTPANTGNPLAGGTFTSDSFLKSFSITGRAKAPGAVAEEAFDSTFVVAARIGSASIASLDSTGGSLTWGFAYESSSGPIKAAKPQFFFDPKKDTETTLDDFRVVQI